MESLQKTTRRHNLAGQFFPEPDLDFAPWAFNFANEVPAIVTALGLAATVDDAYIAARTAFGTAMNNHIASVADALNIRQLKDVAKEVLISELRTLHALLRAQPGFTDAMALQLGLPVYDTTPTSSEAVQTDVPELLVDNSTPNHHTIDFSRAGVPSPKKPAWSKACRITYAIVPVGGADPEIGDMQLLAVDTSAPYEWDIPAGNVGKTVWYRAAWENVKGELGGWSLPAKATVTG